MRPCFRSRRLVAALLMLVAVNLVGFSDLVLCIGTDGHHAFELGHAGTVCPTLAGSADGTSAWLAGPTECLDLPASGSGPVAPSSRDEGRLPAPQAAVLAAGARPAPSRAARLPAEEPLAGSARGALHLRSTVLLV